jgi:D-alanine-D-alanine ligase
MPSLTGGGTLERLPSVEPQPSTEVVLSRVPGHGALVASDGSETDVDVVFPLLHGPFGEDGTVQGLLELAGVPYVGAGVLASAVGMDKAVAKLLFKAAGLRVSPYVVVGERDWAEDTESVAAQVEALGSRVFVKPANLGSSVGITKVRDPGTLASALDEAFRYDTKAVVEASVEGAREIECAVLGNDEPVASLPGEVDPGGEFYDYASKYLDEGSRLIIPAKLPQETIDEIQRQAVAAFRAIDCSGMARVDFFLREPAEIVINEINTIPGFTSISMYPKMWEASGISYPELLDRLIELALQRHRTRSGKATEPSLPPASRPGSARA